jgi:hypothetical protein
MPNDIGAKLAAMRALVENPDVSKPEELRGFALASLVDLAREAVAAGNYQAAAGVMRTLAEHADRSTSTQASSLLTSREWIELKTKLIGALQPYPEAAAAVRAALRDAGDDGCTQFTSLSEARAHFARQLARIDEALAAERSAT